MSLDQYANSNVLLLHGNGTDGSTTVTDSSLTPKTVSVFGNAKISTAQSVFGGSSLYFDGSGDYLSVPSSTSFNFGTGDYAIEFWFRPGSIGTTQTIMARYTVWSTAVHFYLELMNTGAVRYRAGNSLPISLTSTTLLVANTWVHVKVSCAAGTTKLIINGTQEASTATTSSLTSTGLLGIGYELSGGSGYLNGYLDDIRITSNARSATDTVVPTEEYPNFSSLLAATLPSLSMSAAGGGTASLSLPGLSMYAGLVGSGSAEISLPGLDVSAFGGNASALTLPALRANITGHHSSGERGADITLPRLSTSITTGANMSAELPSLTASSSGTVTSFAAVSISLPSLVGSFSGTVAGTASAAIGLPSFTSAAYSGALCSVTLGAVTMQAAGTTGSIGGAQITLPLFQATVTATAQNHGSVNIVLPSLGVRSGGSGVIATLPSLLLTAVGTAVVTATYEAYAVNLKHAPRPNTEPVDETTHYTNFPFTHVVRYQNSYYGANSTGLYLLEGTTDDATPIPWAVKTAMTDFKSPTKKTLASAIFSGRFGPASTIKLHAGEQVPNSYGFSTPRDALAQNHRQVFGKGLKERYYALEALGTGVCELDNIELDVHNLARRI